MSAAKDDISQTEDGVKRNMVDLDTILVQEVGQFGWFQARAVVLGLIVTIFLSYGTNEYVFTTARIRSR